MKIIDLFFPTGVKCIFCGFETKEFGICDECYKNLPFITGKVCARCGGRVVGDGELCPNCENRNFSFVHAYCVLDYIGDVREKLLSFKKGSNKHIGVAFAKLLADKFHSIENKIDVVMPVPISANRKKQRGFNQSEVLCGQIDENLLDFTTLVRVKDTPHQTGLTRKNRETNLIGAFEVTDKSKIKGKTILLVDDIYTTGSTLNECAKTLVKNGAKHVYALCLARTPTDIDKWTE